MYFTLNDFEYHIDAKILKRGQDYFYGGNILEMETLSPTTYEFSIEGAELYTVEIELEGEQVRECSCDCPYDFGDICKHIVAALYELQGTKNVQPTPTKQEKTVKKSTVKNQLDQLLAAIPEDKLKAFIHEKAMRDASFRAEFLSSFAHLSNQESSSYYQKQIQKIFNNARGRGGYVEWSQIPVLTKAVANFLMTAQRHFEAKRFQTAFWMLTAALEELTEGANYIDDSRGSIGDNVYYALDLMEQLFEVPLTESQRVTCFNYCLTAFNERRFKGWDWHWNMLDYAVMLAKTTTEGETVLASLKPEEVTYEWDKRQLEKARYDLLLKLKGEKEAQQYLESHLSNKSFREKAIEQAIEAEKYEQAVAYAEAGIQQDQKEAPGLVKHWTGYLLKIAELQKDRAKIIEYARYLFMDNFNPERDHYAILKAQIPAEGWPAFVEELIADLTKEQAQRISAMYGLVPQIYIREGYWDRLFELVQKNPDLHTLEHYEPYLKKDYAAELILLYQKGILKMMEEQTGRGAYQKACSYILHIQRLGAPDIAKELVSTLKELYPRRSALLDELRRLSW